MASKFISRSQGEDKPFTKQVMRRGWIMESVPGQYTVKQTMAAVKLDLCIRSHGAVTTISAGSPIIVVGRSLMPDMVEVQWNGNLHAVFEQDLHDKCDPGEGQSSAE